MLTSPFHQDNFHYILIVKVCCRAAFLNTGIVNTEDQIKILSGMGRVKIKTLDNRERIYFYLTTAPRRYSTAGDTLEEAVDFMYRWTRLRVWNTCSALSMRSDKD